MKKMIKDLKKDDRFVFNSKTYLVKRKYINDDKPLIAFDEKKTDDQLFHWEELEVEVAPPNS